jgi:hypothetical protein
MVLRDAVADLRELAAVHWVWPTFEDQSTFLAAHSRVRAVGVAGQSIRPKPVLHQLDSAHSAGHPIFGRDIAAH